MSSGFNYVSLASVGILVSGSAPAVQLLSSRSLKRWSSSSVQFGPFNWPPASRRGANYSSFSLSFAPRAFKRRRSCSPFPLTYPPHCRAVVFFFSSEKLFLFFCPSFRGMTQVSFRRSHVRFILILSIKGDLTQPRETWSPNPRAQKRESRTGEVWSLQR